MLNGNLRVARKNAGKCAETAPDFGISPEFVAHGPPVQKELLVRRRRSPVSAWTFVSALTLVGAALSGCVTGQLVEDSSTDLPTPGAGGSGSSSAAGSAGMPAMGGTASTMGGAPTTGGAGAGGTLSAAGHGGTGGTVAMGGAAGTVAMGGTGGTPVTECTTKRGIAYSFDNANANPDMNALKTGVSWYYGWTSAPSNAARPVYAAMNIEFVPMVWGGDFKVSDVENSIPGGAKYLLGFNEPNFGKESNLQPAAAAGLWPQIQQIAAAKNLQIVSPAVNYCGGDCTRTDPFQWLDDFFAACPGCKVDYIGAHWYACTINALQDYITKMKKYNKPIWLTEFACADGGPYTPDQVKTYLLQATLWLEHEPSIFRYSWFSGRTDGIPNVNLLADAGGQLTALGQAYVGQSPKRCP